MTIKELIDQLDTQVREVFDEYNDLHRQLHQYGNRVLNDEDYKKGLHLMELIQDKYAEIHPAFNYVGIRYEQVAKAVHTHTDWIEKLKQASSMTGTKEQAEEILKRGNQKPQELNIVH
jgi:uncharacterized protein YoxC